MTKTPRERILERALEMALDDRITCGVCPRRNATIMCGDFSECGGKACLRANRLFYVRKATNESKAKGEK